MTPYQRDEIRWNKKGYFERFDGKKYWRKLCVIDGCMKRAKVNNWCKRHYTEQKEESLISSDVHFPSTNYVSQIPMPPPSYLYTSTTENNSSSSSANVTTTTNIVHTRNEIRLNKRGYREQYDGIGHWRPLCMWEDCLKRAKRSSYCKRHYTEQINHP